MIKSTYFSVALLGLLAFSSPALCVDYPAENVEKKGDVFYVKETGEPLTGTVIRNYPGGTLKSAFVNGLLNGESQGFFKNGQLDHSITFKNNEKEGPFKKYSEEGRLIVNAMYKGNQLNGDFIAYYPDGSVYMKESYQNDKLNGEKVVYYETGQMKSKASYKNNLLDGESVEYYENGQLRSKNHFKNNQREGLSQIYYPNGKVQFEVHYANNKLDGENKNYLADGKLSQKRIYRNGLVVSGILYQGDKEEALTPDQIDELNSKTVVHSSKNTVQKDGLFLDKETQKPISGTYVQLNQEGVMTAQYQMWNGQEHGLMESYDEQGRIVEQAVFETGKKTAYRLLNSDGKVIKTCTVADGKEVCKE